eukprot:Gregarina_sp_Poly_1__3170@NODE_189_length_11663_cov_119_423594_g168_i0_p6_GENE_NODE_189_length_11663_cov_119_423594_g168_i0NODE_189_length_11663_cov_119_423594_g168_i0_p6_ORF_typecomplete_len281_score27_96FXR_C1/PF16096_5/4_4e03FXR_C1/PF16096_5/3_2e03FXR_C1/PF16096_5/0_21_NODE_189_length_11663_cov_119_423594_g168_i01066011502
MAEGPTPPAEKCFSKKPGHMVVERSGQRNVSMPDKGLMDQECSLDDIIRKQRVLEPSRSAKEIREENLDHILNNIKVPRKNARKRIREDDVRCASNAVHRQSRRRYYPPDPPPPGPIPGVAPDHYRYDSYRPPSYRRYHSPEQHRCHCESGCRQVIYNISYAPGVPMPQPPHLVSAHPDSSPHSFSRSSTCSTYAEYPPPEYDTGVRISPRAPPIQPRLLASPVITVVDDDETETFSVRETSADAMFDSDGPVPVNKQKQRRSRPHRSAINGECIVLDED